MNRIIEIIELGTPQCLIQRDGAPTSELIDAIELTKELNNSIIIPQDKSAEN